MAEKVVIIGSGPAGWTAAIYCARANLNPLVFEGAITEDNRIKGTLPLGQLALTTEVENFPGFPSGKLFEYLGSSLPVERQPYWVQDKTSQPAHGVTGPELMELMRQQAVNFGTRIITDDITHVDFSKKPFTIHSLEGKTTEAMAVIIATGARANYIGLPSEDTFKNRGVSACAVCDGALPRFRNKPLVVVGGGDSAVEEATYLSKFASIVYLVHRRDKLRASKIMQDRALNNPKIEVRWNTAVSEIIGDDQLQGVKLVDTVTGAQSTLDIAGLFIAIGHRPNTDVFKGVLDMEDSGYLITRPDSTYTNIPGVFACGDVKDHTYRQAITAAGSGCMAAIDAERWLEQQH